MQMSYTDVIYSYNLQYTRIVRKKKFPTIFHNEKRVYSH